MVTGVFNQMCNLNNLMMIREAKGNMYKFITHTWNPIQGKCLHDCKYCYMKRSPQYIKPIFIESEMTAPLDGKFIFIGSTTDVFANNIPSEWINRILNHCLEEYKKGNRSVFLLQSKNPKRFLEFINHPIMKRCVLCTTIETNRFYPDFMRNAPKIEERVEAMEEVAKQGIATMVTAEPLMQFDLETILEHIRRCQPKVVNIGRNTRRNIELPEPTKEEVQQLISGLQEFTKVHVKENGKFWLA